MVTEEYSWPGSLFARYQYLEYAGNCHMEATEPERIEHGCALVNSKLTYVGDVADRVKRISDRHTDLTSLHRHLAQLERKYLRDFHQVLNDAQLEHTKAIDRMAEAYAASQSFWQVEDDFPRWSYIRSHIQATEDLFGLMAGKASRLFISNAADEWHRQHQRLSTALRQTADIRKKMRDAISAARQREREVRLDAQGIEALDAANEANKIAQAANGLAGTSNTLAQEANKLSERAFNEAGRANKIAKRTALWTGLGVFATAIPVAMGLFDLRTLKETVDALQVAIQQGRTAPSPAHSQPPNASTNRPSAPQAKSPGPTQPPSAQNPMSASESLQNQHRGSDHISHDGRQQSRESASTPTTR